MKPLTTGLTNLVSLLNDGQCHDGTRIGRELNITRSAVWKAIKKLENYGIKIDSAKGKGYSLLEPLILLKQKTIEQNIAHKNIDIQVFETVNSTNDYLKSGLPHKTVKICLAEQQTQGKGRLHRSWYSPFGQNIYFSCAYLMQKDVSELAGLSLVVSLAIIKTLESFHLPHPLLVKWPNDIIYDNKKISGTLIEVQAESHSICHAIIGIGINANMMPEKNLPITQNWTSLRNIIGNYVDRNQLCILLIDHLITYLTLFQQQGLSSFMTEWSNVDFLFNKKIILKCGNKKISGQAKGVTNIGRLILKLSDGTSQTFSSGDTSIMK